MSKPSLVLIAFVAGLILAIGLMMSRHNAVSLPIVQTVIRERVDTVRQYVILRQRELRVHHAATLREYVDSERCDMLDTLLAVDTNAIGPDTLHIEHCLPSNVFSVLLRPASRRLAVALPVLVRDTFEVRHTAEHAGQHQPASERPWYAEALVILGALTAGLLFGRLF